MKFRWLCLLRYTLLVLVTFSSSSMAYWNCAWPYRTEVTLTENSGADQTDYQVEITLTGAQLNSAYDWTNNGFDLRVIDSDDESLLDFWIESWNRNSKTATVFVRFDLLRANSNRKIYLYYGNQYADELANVPFTFVEPGIKFHTRNSTANPNSLAEALAAFDAGNDNVSGYGCTFITNFTNVNNRNTFGARNNFIATSETYFKVEDNEVGTWSVRYGADFGGGGGLYVDGIPLEEDWLNDLWWSRRWNHVDVLQGSISLSAGYHKLEVIGAEGCCDGGITVQFQRPGQGWQTYSTSNIDIRSRACPIAEPTISFGAHATGSCPPAIASYRLDEGNWGGTNDVVDQTGTYPGSMIGTVSHVNNTQVCRGAGIAANSSDSDVSAIQTGVDIDELGPVGSFAFWIKLNNDWNDGLNRKIIDASYLPNGVASEKYFYVDKLPGGNLEFRFEDSSDADFRLTEATGANRLADQWYHITLTFDFPNSQFQIFLNESLVADQLVNTNGNAPITNGRISDLAIIQFGDKIPSPALGGAARSTDGVFDEINIYDSVLSISQIRGLMAKTRDCTDVSGQPFCVSTFPNGINTLNYRNNRTISFGENAQLINNPDNVLSARTVTKTSWSTLLTCNTSDCVAGDVTVDDVSPGNFQQTNARNDVDVGFMSTTTIGSTTNEFDDVRVNSLGTLNTTNSHYSEFFIDKLEANSSSTVNFAAGSYWINDLTLGADAKINVIDNGPVRLYVNRFRNWSSDVLINSPSRGLAGNSDALLIYTYDSVTFGYRPTISASIYSKKDLDTNQEATVYGLITAKNVTLGLNSRVYYDDDAYTGLGDIAWCEQGARNVASITLTAPATAINCQPATVDIQVRDNQGAVITEFEGAITLTTNTAHGDWTLDGTANGSLVQTTANSGSATYNMVAADAGVVRLYLKNTHVETLVINATINSVIGSATTQYQASGFVFANIGQQVAGLQSSGHQLTAVETDGITGACKALLLNNQTVQLAFECRDPSSCGAGVGQVQSTAVATNNAGSVSNYSNVTLNFSDSTSSTASFSLQYSEAGQYRLHARYALLDNAGNSTGNWIQGISNDVTSTPAGFCIDSTDSNWQCTTPGLTANCSRFKKAGESFNVRVTAKAYQASSTDYCSHTTTANFNGNVSISHSLVSPSVSDGGVAGTFNVALVALSSGSGSINGVLSEMGAFQFSAGGNAYLGATLPSNGSATFGRFYPQDFHIVTDLPATFNNGSSGFTYIGQTLSDGVTGAMGYAVAPTITFVARNTTGDTLTNFRSPFAQLPVASVTASSATLGTTGNPLSVTAGFNSGSFSGPDASSQYQYQFSAADHFRFDRGAESLIAPFNNDIQLTITAFADSIDGVALSSANYVISGSGGSMYYGRLRLENGYGPETSAVPQFLIAEYFNGSDFVPNSLDNSTDYDTANFGGVTVTDVGDVGDPLLSTDSSVSGATSNTGFLSGGRTQFLWSAPLGGRYGTYRVPYGAPSWLQYDWNGAGDEDPSATVSFGRFRGHDKVIYWKEIIY